MKANLSIYKIKSKEDIEKLQFDGNFMISDICGAIYYEIIPIISEVTLVCINGYDGLNHNPLNQDEKKKIIEYCLDLFKDNNNCIICTTAYVSTSEFPETEWEIDPEKAEKYGKKLIDVESVVERDGKVLQELGFININFYVDYTTKEAYVYGNDLGQIVYNYLIKNFKVKEIK